MPETDPFTKVYEALWELASSFEPFTNLVTLRNRISFAEEGNRTPVKNLVSTGDLPEVILAPTGGIANLHAATNYSRIAKTYDWLISTGDLRIKEGGLFPIEFALMRAMCNWKTPLSALTWNGNTFVKRCDLTDVSEGQSDTERNRGIKGWSALWSCEVEMYFNTSDLQDEGSYSGD